MAAATGTTIAAVASPPGRGVRAVLRLSGPDARRIALESCRTPAGPPALLARGFETVRFHDGRGEQPALLLWMPGPRSFTREDVVELHLPGAPPLVARALERVLALGAVPAGPGEFTRRAFLSGRLDLTRAEGVLALVSARSVEERRSATALLFGGLEERMQALRDTLDTLRALCEASLDFDESDTGHVPMDELRAGAEGVLSGLSEALAWEERRFPPPGEPRIVLTGAPNAGKSLLFNRLTGERAIVSDFPGTTRDRLNATWTLAGVPCRLADTAGTDAAARGPDEEAQVHARAEREAADLELFVIDAAGGADEEPGPTAGARLLVWNKIDLAAARPFPPGPLAEGPWVAVSAATGAGLESLAEKAAEQLGLGGGGTPRAGVARELTTRHKHSLREAKRELADSLAALDVGLALDLFAESLRAATDHLDRITGRTTPEDLLDRIFARFCLGK